MAAVTPKNTPKRKRGDDAWPSPIKFSFEPPCDPGGDGGSDDGGSSPRSKVAHKFRGLALGNGSASSSWSGSGSGRSGGSGSASGSGGGVVSPDDSEASESIKKRQRPDEAQLRQSPSVGDVVDLDGHSTRPPGSRDGAWLGDSHASGEPCGPSSEPSPGDLQHTYPSINRLADSASRTKKRPSSPPLRIKTTSRRPEDDASEDDADIVDPVRAALTWHEDEITIYDPDDEDDDGTGINGIGFKPTPALAQARSRKRRQQMAEYRRREDTDARARRSERRRRRASVTLGRPDKSPASRKVRFMDAEAQNFAITTK